jgi:hypothetical protein
MCCTTIKAHLNSQFLVLEQGHIGDKKACHALAASLFRITDEGRTVLLDEMDNQDLSNNATLRSVLNSGHRRGGRISRIVNGEKVEFGTYAPLALAIIGKLPLPLLHRSAVIPMQRAPHDLAKFDENNAESMADPRVTARLIARWAANAQINFNPELPAQFRNRASDNWRLLIGIADAISPQAGKVARQSAVVMSVQQDEDIGVILIGDIISIFDARGVDRLPSADVVSGLHEFDHGMWAEWRGKRGNEQPRKLSQPQLAALLRDFKISPRTVWILHHQPGTKSSKGYYRSQFEAAWEAYCKSDTPSQARNVRYLRR